MADVLDFTDQIVAKLTDSFALAGAAVTLSREYEVQVDLGKFTGLIANVFPVAYKKDKASTRRDDVIEAESVIVVAERYTAQGKPPRAWMDTRVSLVETAVFDSLRAHPLLLGGVRWLCEIEVTTVFDLKLLRQHKVFWSEIEVIFQRLR